MKALIVGVVSAVIVFICYSIYEFVYKRYFRFRRSDFTKWTTHIKFSDETSSFLWEKYRGKVGQLLTSNKKGEEVSTPGIEIAEADEAILADLRSNLSEDYLIFISDFNKKNKKIGIIKGYDKYLILKNMQTNGDSINLSNGKLINELKSIDKAYPFSITGAGNDWLELDFKSLPEEIGTLTERLKALFPPDDSSSGNIEQELKENNKIFIWWPSKE